MCRVCVFACLYCHVYRSSTYLFSKITWQSTITAVCFKFFPSAIQSTFLSHHYLFVALLPLVLFCFPMRAKKLSIDVLSKEAMYFAKFVFASYILMKSIEHISRLIIFFFFFYLFIISSCNCFCIFINSG